MVANVADDKAGIRATGVTCGLRRVPAGFYTLVHHSGLKWRTENKRSSVNDDVVEWNGPIPIPSDPPATVCLEVYASFEFHPMLGTGEQLRKLTITVERLLDQSEKHIREWERILHNVRVLTSWQHLPSSQKMATLYPRVRLFL
ncbi:hypothetical protein EV363DRAFT_1168303 [Boletus edulis]|nr:hypothetical protein EV363DRAFT_1168303 [Boletus edulis]